MDLNTDGPTPASLLPTERVAFGSWAVARVRLAWKGDVLRSDGKAREPKRREGGWGAVTKAMRDAVGGEWTARALSSLQGLSARLE